MIRILVDPAAAERRHRPGGRTRCRPPGDRGALFQIGLTGQFAAVDEKLTGRENLRLFGRLYPYLPGNWSGQRAEELLDRFDLLEAAGDGSGADLFRWHAAAPGHRGQPPVDPRCCFWTSRPPGWTRAAATRSGTCPGRGPRGHHGHADDPISRRGRPTGRPDRRHRPRPVDRRGHPHRPQSRHRRRAHRGRGRRPGCSAGRRRRTRRRSPPNPTSPRVPAGSAR